MGNTGLLIAGANLKREGRGFHVYMLMVLFPRPILINPLGKKEIKPSVNVHSASRFPNVISVTGAASPRGGCVCVCVGWGDMLEETSAP